MDHSNLPSHIAIVMDGNGRWAQEKKLPRLAGHNSGMLSLKEIVKACSRRGIGHLTVYAFSTENWKRPEEEVKGIFKLIIVYIEKELAELHGNNVKVGVLGDIQLLPKDAVKSLATSMDTTKNNSGLNLHIALNYGSRDEITRSMQSVAELVRQGMVDPNQITDNLIATYLDTAGVPDPDLLIRTGGEKRLSNFLLWQCAYSELWFTDVYWPDFTPEHLDLAISDFQHRKRRFGDIK